MELSKFKNLCKALGKSDVKDGEEWKTVKYVHTPGQGSPAFDVEQKLYKNEITFSEDPPGFIVTEPPASDVMMMINDNTAVKTFFDLNHITDLSFQVDDSIRDIYDVMTRLNNCKLPLRIVFITESTQEYYNYDGTIIPIYEFDDVTKIRVPFKSMKSGVIEKTDYDLSMKKITGEEVTKIEDPGDYIVTISGKGKYIGSSSALVRLNK